MYCVFKGLGSECTQNFQCLTTNAVCSDGLCECDGRSVQNNRAKCECDEDKFYVEQEDGTCKCPDGYKELGSALTGVEYSCEGIYLFFYIILHICFNTGCFFKARIFSRL